MSCQTTAHDPNPDFCIYIHKGYWSVVLLGCLFLNLLLSITSGKLLEHVPCRIFQKSVQRIGINSSLNAS